MSKDYYKILEISRDASVKEIGEAYRKAAKKYHPDLNHEQEAGEKFKEAAEAFEVLSDPQKRSHYDRFGDNVPNASFHVDPFSVFGDWFKDIFSEEGESGPHVVPRVYRRCEITLEEAFLGCQKTVTVGSMTPCAACHETGASEWETCKTCIGRGRHNRVLGNLHVSTGCQTCQGKGRIPKQTCPTCKGQRFLETDIKEVLLDIHPGVAAGTKLIHAGAIFEIVILPHRLYERRGNNLYCTVPLTFAQLLLGHDLTLPALSGDEVVAKVPSGSLPESVMRLSGMGMPHRLGSGDLFVKLHQDMPENPSLEYLDLVKKLSEMDDNQSYGQIKSFLENKA